MPEARSSRLRKAVFTMWDAGSVPCSVRELHVEFPTLHRATIYRWVQAFKRLGTWRRQTLRQRARRGRVSAAVLEALRELLAEESCLFQDEIQCLLLERYGFEVSTSSINRTIHRKVEKGGLGFSRLVTQRRARQRVDAERADFLSTIQSLRDSGVTPDQFIVLDEAHKSNSELLRRFGYGPSGKPLVRTEFFKDGESFSLLGAADIDGFLEGCCMVTDEKVDSEFYAGWIQGCICPALGNFLGPNKRHSIVIMDNVRPHPASPPFLRTPPTPPSLSCQASRDLFS